MKYSKDNLPPKGAVARTLSKYMFIRKGGEAYHCLAPDFPDNAYDCEAIYVYGEDGDYWVGNYCEGYGLIDIRFLKADCRDATEEEKRWIEDNDGSNVWSVKF